MKETRIISSIIKTTLMVFLFTSCGSSGASEGETETTGENTEQVASPESVSSEAINQSNTSGSNEASAQQKPKMPEPEVELPTLPFDKSKLPTVMKLDEMIMDEERLQVAFDLVYNELRVLREKVEQSMSGTREDIVKIIMTKVNGVNHFNAYALPVAQESIRIFKNKYASDSEFGSLFRDTYYAAEKEISGGSLDGDHIIEDDVKRREVSSHFANGYGPSRSSNLYDIEGLIEDSEELTQDVIESVVGQADIDMMIADYKKGKDLTDMLNGTINNLKMVQPLDPDNEQLATSMKQVMDKKKSRLEEIKKSLEEYRFPERYSGGNAPSDAKELESRMKSFLSKFKRTSDKNYEVLVITVAGPWINVYNALTGAHMYSQIDFYVAVPALGEDEEGLVDVLYVTGKTGGPHHDAFGSYSVGGFGQMKKSNL